MKRFFALLALIVVVLAVVIVFRGARMKSKQSHAEPIQPIQIDTQSAAEHLSRAIQFKTVSFGVPSPLSKDDLVALREWIETTYPKTHTTLKHEVLRGLSLLYTWQGSDPSLKPLLLMGHMDVVPVPPGSEQDWKQPPFEGRIADGAVWGRGSMDDKLCVIGSLEAVEWLVNQGYQPKRTIMMAFGHDEEVGGREGAQKTAALLKERGVEVECAIDEGGIIVDGMMPGVTSPVALVGVAEKGYLTINLTVQQPGGHSSMPPQHSAAGILATAITRLENHQMPEQLAGPALQLFETIGPEMPFSRRLIFGNLWIFRPLVEHILGGAPETNAMIRTTTAVTMISGGVKENVLPPEASATVNFRILPGDTIESVLAHVRDVVADERVTIAPLKETENEPSHVSDTNVSSYRTLEKTIRQVCPDVLVAPYLVVAATDSRHFEVVTPNVYRFVPSRFRKGETAMIHGVNEHISVDNFGEVVKYYVQLIRNFND